jgi:hypothetical protein
MTVEWHSISIYIYICMHAVRCRLEGRCYLCLYLCLYIYIDTYIYTYIYIYISVSCIYAYLCVVSQQVDVLHGVHLSLRDDVGEDRRGVAAARPDLQHLVGLL